MTWVARGVFLAAAAGSGVVTSRALAARNGRRSSGPESPPHGRWHTLTVNRPIDVVAPLGQLPERLAALEGVEVEVRPAPGDRGTELAVRLREGEPSGLASVTARLTGHDPRHAVRRALRDTRSELETGEVLLPDAPSTTRRTLLSTPLAYATAHGREEGLL